MDKIKVLDIGSGIEESSAQIHDMLNGDLEITRLDIEPRVHPDILHDITKPLPKEHRGQYDIVFSSHMLEHMRREDVIPTVRNMASALKNYGELWIIVPSLEWAASQIMQHHNGLQIEAHIFGAQRPGNEYDIHKCGFTLRDLRQVVEICGLLVKRAFQSQFYLILDDRKWLAVQNIIIGARVDGLYETEEERKERHQVEVVTEEEV